MREEGYGDGEERVYHPESHSSPSAHSGDVLYFEAVLKLPKSARFTESSMLWEITMKIQFLRLRSP